MAKPHDPIPEQIDLPPARRPDGHRAFTLQEQIDLNRIRALFERIDEQICDFGHHDDTDDTG